MLSYSAASSISIPTSNRSSEPSIFSTPYHYITITSNSSLFLYRSFSKIPPSLQYSFSNSQPSLYSFSSNSQPSINSSSSKSSPSYCSSSNSLSSIYYPSSYFPASIQCFSLYIFFRYFFNQRPSAFGHPSPLSSSLTISSISSHASASLPQCFPPTSIFILILIPKNLCFFPHLL